MDLVVAVSTEIIIKIIPIKIKVEKMLIIIFLNIKRNNFFISSYLIEIPI